MRFCWLALSVLTQCDCLVNVSILEWVSDCTGEVQSAPVGSPQPYPHWIRALKRPGIPGISSAIMGTRGVPNTILGAEGILWLRVRGTPTSPKKIDTGLSRRRWTESRRSKRADCSVVTPRRPQRPQLAPLHRPLFGQNPVLQSSHPPTKLHVIIRGDPPLPPGLSPRFPLRLRRTDPCGLGLPLEHT